MPLCGVRVHIATPIDSIDLSKTLSDLIDCNDWGLLACQEYKMAHLHVATARFKHCRLTFAREAWHARHTA